MTPAVVIEIRIEAKAPRISVCCKSEGEERRLNDWLLMQPQLLELIEQALKLQAQEPAA